MIISEKKIIKEGYRRSPFIKWFLILAKNRHSKEKCNNFFKHFKLRRIRNVIFWLISWKLQLLGYAITHLCLKQCQSNGLLRFFKYGSIPASFSFIFVLFSFQSQLQFQQYYLKKRRWCSWDSNPGLQDGRCRLNNGAIAILH